MRWIARHPADKSKLQLKTMKIVLRAGLFSAAVLLFLYLNGSSYNGYFRDDGYDNANWTRVPSLEGYVQAFFTPLYIKNNFRPVGHYFFRVLGNTYDLDFPKWVAWIHVLHFANLILIWLLARRLGAGIAASSLGALFFLAHAAIVEAVWQPMYVFDQFCALFCIASLLLYHQRRYVLSFVAFWFAIKSKEPGLMLPVSLLAMEFWFGGHKWWRLVPFFLISLSLGLPGVLGNQTANSSYSFSFAPLDLWKTISFYASQVLLIPLAGLLILAVPFLVHKRAVWLGLILFVTTLVPVLILPNRISGAYLYLPLAGIAIAIGSFAESKMLRPVALALALWFPLNIYQLWKNQAVLIRQAAANRAFVEMLSAEAPSQPRNTLFVIDTHPEQFHFWGIQAVLRRSLKRNDADIRLETVQNGDAFQKLLDQNTAHLVWIPEQLRMKVVRRPPDAPLQSFLDFNSDAGDWQLGEGWHLPVQGVRWAEVFATAHMERPNEASEFEITVDVIPELLRAEGSVRLLVLHNPDVIANCTFEKPGRHTLRRPVPAGRGGPIRLEFLLGPDYKKLPDSQRPLALQVKSFGFVKK